MWVHAAPHSAAGDGEAPYPHPNADNKLIVSISVMKHAIHLIYDAMQTNHSTFLGMSL